MEVGNNSGEGNITLEDIIEKVDEIQSLIRTIDDHDHNDE